MRSMKFIQNYHNEHTKIEFSMKFIQNYHNEHTKIEFGMLIVVILYEFHTSHFAVQIRLKETYNPIGNLFNISILTMITSDLLSHLNI